MSARRREAPASAASPRPNEGAPCRAAHGTSALLQRQGARWSRSRSRRRPRPRPRPRRPPRRRHGRPGEGAQDPLRAGALRAGGGERRQRWPAAGRFSQGAQRRPAERPGCRARRVRRGLVGEPFAPQGVARGLRGFSGFVSPCVIFTLITIKICLVAGRYVS